MKSTLMRQAEGGTDFAGTENQAWRWKEPLEPQFVREDDRYALSGKRSDRWEGTAWNLQKAHMVDL